jgi:hypothetical protein
MNRLNLKNLNEGKVKEQYDVTIKNRFSAVDNLEDNGDNSRECDSIRENIKISAKECIGHCQEKSYKPRFYEECSKFVDRSKQDKLQ